VTSTVQELIRKHDTELLNHPDIQAAVAELEGIIRRGCPDARFDVGIGHDPLGVYITATVDVEDADEIADLYIDREAELQVEERLPVHVIAVRPPHRWMQDVPATEAVGHNH